MDVEERAVPLAGQTVLVVEDQYLIAEDLCALVERLGGTVMGPVPGVEAALDLLRAGRPDLAMLDVNLEGERVYDVCTALREAEIPFLFITGYDAAVIHPHFRAVPCLEKPVEEAALRGAIARL
ncbi:response regulator [Pararoseomonas sp. SCSIO 73927]|uniref:response regulator n=1 Tax=Pararoseomonas sp. SCSIO 73927 TaxID=3114537 RepID=UPI0030CA812D